MDQPQYSKLIEPLQHIPDPRKARGKQLEWLFLLGVIAAALLSQQRHPRAMAQWARHHAATLIAAFQPRRGRVPSESTLLRTLRHVDVPALEQHLTQFTQSVAAPAAPLPPTPAASAGVGHGTALPLPPPAPAPLVGQALDGKAIRGAQAHGQRTHLVSLVQHGSAHVLAQVEVAQKRSEITAAPLLLHGRCLRGIVITLDALLTQRKLAEQILTQQGHYLMVVKRNQRQLYDELSWFFQTPPLPCEAPWREDVRVGKGHGRLETRRLTCTADLDGYLTWPGVQQVLRRECERIILKTGEVTRAVTYGLTSLTPAEATARDLAGLWQGHWTIENRVHYVRDVTLGEDAGQVHTGHGPQALAALRNALISLLRHSGWTNIADALRYYHDHIHAALDLIGVRPLWTLT
jgi:predicted transposase YbfD/YdcC